LQPQQFVRGSVSALTNKHSLVISNPSDWLGLTMKWLGVVVSQEFSRTTTTAIKSRGLFTHEETLKVLAGAL